MPLEKKGEISLTFGTMILYWDSENAKIIFILKIGDQFIGTFKTFLAIEKDPADVKTFSEIYTYGFGAKNRYDSLGNLLSWLNRTDDFSITAIFRKPAKDELAIVRDPKQNGKLADLREREKALNLTEQRNQYKYGVLYGHYTEDASEKKAFREILWHTEAKKRQNQKDIEDTLKVIDIQEGIIQKVKDNSITSALIFDILYKPIISGNLLNLLDFIVEHYRNTGQSIKAKLQQHGLKAVEIKDFDVAVSLFVPSLFNPEYYNGVSHPAVEAFAKMLKNYYEASLAQDIKHEGYTIEKKFSPAVIFEQIITANVNKPKEAEKIHIPDPRFFHYNKDDLLLPFGFVVRSVNEQKLTNIAVHLKINELSRSLALFGLQGFGKSLTLCSIALGLYYHGIKGVVIDPHGTLTGIYKPLTNREVLAELDGFGIPVKQLKPAEGKIYTVLSDDGIRFSTKILANPVPEAMTNDEDRRIIARMYARGLFSDMIPNFCGISTTNPEMAHLESYCVDRFIHGEDTSLEELHDRIKNSDIMVKFERILDLKDLIDSNKPTCIGKLINDSGISTILLNNLNVYAPPNARNIPMDMLFYAVFSGMHKDAQSRDYETSKTERVLIADELGVMDRNMSLNAVDYIGKCVREDRKRGTGYVLGSQRSVHISPSARSTNMTLYFRTNLMNDIKTLKSMYPEEEGDNANDVSLVSKLPKGYVFADLGSDFYSKPLFLKIMRPCCQHTGMTAGEIREMMQKYREDAPKIKFDMMTVEDRILAKVKEVNDKGVKPSKNQICREIGGEKQRILGIVNALIAEGKLSYDTDKGGLSIVRTTTNQFGHGGNFERRLE